MTIRELARERGREVDALAHAVNHDEVVATPCILVNLSFIRKASTQRREGRKGSQEISVVGGREAPSR